MAESRGASKQVAVSILIAGGALLAAVGGTTEDEGWFWFAGGALVAGLVVATWPESGKVSPITRLGYWLRQVTLRRHTAPGWEANVWVGPLSAVVSTATNTGEALEGFLCEVLTPSGRFYAYTHEAATVFGQTGMRGALDLPLPQTGASRLFPKEFEPPPAPDLHGLPRGRYRVLWWAWERADDGFTVKLVFVATGTFRVRAPRPGRLVTDRKFKRHGDEKGNG